MEYSFVLFYIAAFVVVQLQDTFSNDNTPESWSECPENLTVYEGCQFTIHALFNAANRSCARGASYSYTIAVNEFEYFKKEDVSVVPINGSETFCNVSTTFSVMNIDHNVTFIASRIPPDPSIESIKCEDLLEIVNDTLGPPTNLNVSVTCDDVIIEWDPPEILPGFSIYQYIVNINSQMYFTNKTRIVISIAEAELVVNEEYLVDISSEYCRGQGRNASTTVIIANKPAVSQVNYAYSNYNESQVAVQLFAGVSQVECIVGYPTELTVQYSCDGLGKKIVKLLTMKNVCVMDDGTIESRLTLPVDQTCDVQLEFQNSFPESTIINISINTRYCTVQPTVEGIMFECDCISRYCGCCGIQVTNVNTSETYFQSSNGSMSYFKLPPGTYSIVCYAVKSCVDGMKLTVQSNTLSFGVSSMALTSSLVVSSMALTSSVAPLSSMAIKSCDLCIVYIAVSVVVTIILCSIFFTTIIIICLICHNFKKSHRTSKSITNEQPEGIQLTIIADKGDTNNEEYLYKRVRESVCDDKDKTFLPGNKFDGSGPASGVSEAPLLEHDGVKEHDVDPVQKGNKKAYHEKANDSKDKKEHHVPEEKKPANKKPIKDMRPASDQKLDDKETPP